MSDRVDAPPAVDPVADVPPQRRPWFALSAPSVALVALVLVTLGFFGVRAALDEDAPSPDELAAAFTPLASFSYEELPSEAMQPLRAEFAKQPEVAHFDARQISKAGQPIAVVFGLALDPDDLTEDFKDDYVTGFERSSQAPVEDLQIAETVGHIASTELGTVIFFFDDDGFAFNVVGPDPRDVESLARALALANS
jgi:hypothetical protein